MDMKSEIRKDVLNACKGAALSLLLGAVLAALASALVLGGVIPQARLETAAQVCGVLAVFCGTLLAQRGQKERLLITGLLGCCLYLAVLLLIGLALPGSTENSFLLPAAFSLAAAAGACVLGGRKPKRGKVRRRKAG